MPQGDHEGPQRAANGHAEWITLQDNPDFRDLVDFRLPAPGTARGKIFGPSRLGTYTESGTLRTSFSRVLASRSSSNLGVGLQRIGRAELDRIGPRTPMCRDFFRRAVALELSLFEAAYADPT
jgi:hypothetical protein